MHLEKGAKSRRGRAKSSFHASMSSGFASTIPHARERMCATCGTAPFGHHAKLLLMTSWNMASR